MLLNWVVAILVVVFILESILDYLNQSRASAPIPANVAHLYDAKERDKSANYGREKYQLGLLSATVMTAITILALTNGWLATLDSWARGITSQPILISLIFIAALSVISQLIEMPFGLYSIFSIEQRYGFNKVTPKTFILDLIKGALVSVLVAGPILALVIWLYNNFTERFWLYGWGLVASFSLFMFMFGTRLILPLFNKLTPLPDGQLRDEIIGYCKTQGYSLTRLFVMDGSKRSTKANAFFSGLGRSKTIVLFDTLIEKLTTKEVVGVLAHEVGHYKRKHTLARFVLSNIQTLAIFALLGWTLRYEELSTALGAKLPSFHLSAITFFILLGPLNLLLGLLNNSLSRRNEFDADQFGANTYSAKALKTALEKISKDSLSNLTPHPAYVAFNYTHPPLDQRLKALS